MQCLTKWIPWYSWCAKVLSRLEIQYQLKLTFNTTAFTLFLMLCYTMGWNDFWSCANVQSTLNGMVRPFLKQNGFLTCSGGLSDQICRYIRTIKIGKNYIIIGIKKSAGKVRKYIFLITQTSWLTLLLVLGKCWVRQILC